jgi:protease I
MRALLVVANEGYQHIEYGIPKKILIDAGIDVETASDSTVPAIAKDGSTTNVDVTLDKVDPDLYDGIFFIGGPGALEHLDNEWSYRIIRHASQNGIPFGAICISTRILAKAGIMTDRKATGWNGDGELDALYKEYDVEYIKKNVVVDKNIITATNPDAAQEFGEKIVGLMS